MPRSEARSIALLACLLPALSLAASGGPDTFGYTWADHNEPGVDTTLPTGLGTPTTITLGDDDVSAPIDLGFTFPYYGVDYTQFVVSDNGWVSLDTTTPSSYPDPQAIPSVVRPHAVIAWYWRDLTAPTSANYRPFPGGMAIFMRTRIAPSAPLIQAWILIYQAGPIKVVYSLVDLPETASIGIESESGTHGLNPWYLGTPENGYDPTTGSAIQYFPPPALDCAAATVIDCGQELSATSPATLPVNVSDYTCTTQRYLGNETVFVFDNPTLSDVRFEITRQERNLDVDVMLLRESQCNEFLCIAQGEDLIDTSFLAAGRYYVVVDGKEIDDNGDFDLQVTCTPKSDILTCGSLGVSGMTSGASQWNFYSCTNLVFDGAEFIYEIPFTAPGNLKVILTPDPGLELDLLTFGPDTFTAPSGCIGYGDSGMTLFDPPTGTYFLVVDGRTDTGMGASGGFTIDVTCDVLLNCAPAAGDLTCFTETTGTTIGAVNSAEQYSCSGDVYDGPERVYRFTNPSRRTISFLHGGDPGLSLLLVGDTCNEGACFEVADGNLIARDLPAGDYFVVVDGRGGAAGPFDITPICDNRVEPDVGSWVLDPGDTVHEIKTACVNADITRGDVVFAMDTTGSMGTAIANLKQTAKNIIDELSSVIDDVQFALVSFEDYPSSYTSCGYSGGYGGGADLPYRLNLPITNDVLALNNAIDGLNATGGGDTPESYTRAYFEMIADAANIGWRPGARQIVVMIGDQGPHSCTTTACTVARSSTGIDPGRDATSGTVDDLEIADVMADFVTEGITPIFLYTGGGALLTSWECLMDMGLGQAYDSPGGTAPPSLVEDIRLLIESKALFCQSLEVDASAGFETWISNVSPPLTTIDLPVKTDFEFDIGPPVGTPPGIYNFTVDIVCDGIVKASQMVTIEVPGVCTPNPQVGVTGGSCSGDPRTYDGSGSLINGCTAPLEYQWRDDLGNIIQPWDPAASVLNDVPLDSTTYTLEIRCSDQVECPLIGTRTFNVDVDPLPPADAGPDRSVCLAEATVLGSPGDPAYTYSWAPSAELDNPLIAEPTFQTAPTAPTGPRAYTLTVTDVATGCTSVSIITVTVEDGAPTGAIGNNLHAARAGDDVVLDWSGAPLSPQSYNVHRELLKTDIDPPVSPALTGVSAIEVFTDIGVVTDGIEYFYEVYGADCAGNSIFN